MTSPRPLPGGWRWAALGEVCVEDRQAITSDDPDYAGMPYLGLEHIEAETGRILIGEDEARFSGSISNNFRFTNRHVLYGKLRPYLNKVALPEFDGRCTTEIIPLLPVEADRGWLAWFLRREETVEYAMRGKTGSRMPRAPMRDLMRLPLAFPPIEEQRRIVADLEARMEAAGRARSAAEAQLAAVLALPAALLRDAFTSRADRQRRAQRARLWRSARLGDVANIIMGQSPPSSTYRDTPDGLPFFQGKADFGAVHPVARKWCTEPIKVAYAGDILMSVRAPVGPTNLADTECCIGRGLAAIRAGAAVEQGFLLGALRAIEGEIASIGTGSTFQAISGKQLRATIIPLPPLDEQRRIVAGLEARMADAERARGAAEAQLAAAEALPSAILRGAFAGEAA